MDPAAAFALLDEALPLGDDGGVEWSRRPFAKRWSLRRLGRAGLSSLLVEQAGAPGRCLVFAAGDPEAVDVATERALDAFESLDPTRPRQAIDARGRWICELAPDGTFTLDFVSRRDTAMLERLRAREREWGRGRT
jgi:hypothetical protein